VILRLLRRGAELARGRAPRRARCGLTLLLVLLLVLVLRRAEDVGLLVVQMRSCGIPAARRAGLPAVACRMAAKVPTVRRGEAKARAGVSARGGRRCSCSSR
jgi:hypothetical protein